MADQRAVDGALAQGVSAIESTYNDLQGHFRRLEGDHRQLVAGQRLGSVHPADAAVAGQRGEG